MSYCFHIFSQHYTSSLYHKEVCVGDARSHIDEVKTRRGQGEEEDEGEEGAIGDPHHSPEHRHLPLPSLQLGLRSQAGFGATVQALNFHECAMNPENTDGSVQRGSENRARAGRRKGDEAHGMNGEAEEPGRRGAGGLRGKVEEEESSGGGPETREPGEAEEGRGRAFPPPGSGGRRGCRWGEAQAARRGALRRGAVNCSTPGLPAAPGIRPGPSPELRIPPPAIARRACASFSGPRRLVPARG